MRVFILQKDFRSFFMDFVYALIGTVAAIFLYPISFTLAVASFLAVQIICEMRQKLVVSPAKKNRFDESFKTAERILHDYAP